MKTTKHAHYLLSESINCILQSLKETKRELEEIRVITDAVKGFIKQTNKQKYKRI